LREGGGFTKKLEAGEGGGGGASTKNNTEKRKQSNVKKILIIKMRPFVERHGIRITHPFCRLLHPRNKRKRRKKSKQIRSGEIKEKYTRTSMLKKK